MCHTPLTEFDLQAITGTIWNNPFVVDVHCVWTYLFMPETSQVTSWFSGLEPATNWLGEWLGNLGHGWGGGGISILYLPPIRQQMQFRLALHQSDCFADQIHAAMVPFGRHFGYVTPNSLTTSGNCQLNIFPTSFRAVNRFRTCQMLFILFWAISSLFVLRNSMVKLCVCVISISILFGWKIVAGFGNNNGQFNFVFTEEKGCVADLNVSKFFNLILWPFFQWNTIKQVDTHSPRV
jgi:hypothetical protein